MKRAKKPNIAEQAYLKPPTADIFAPGSVTLLLIILLFLPKTISK